MEEEEEKRLENLRLEKKREEKNRLQEYPNTHIFSLKEVQNKFH